MMGDKEMKMLYNEYWNLHMHKMKEEGVDLYGIAGVMLAQALSIYKSTLSPEDFNMIMDNISSSRHDVRVISLPSIH